MENAVKTRFFGGGQSNLSSITDIGAGFKAFSTAGQRTVKLGFTLAEVLITLGIIGVVASMTLPSLIQKNKDKELISRVKKTYSVLNNALIAAQSGSGVVGDNSVIFNPQDDNFAVAKNLKKYFNGAKLCENRSQKGCSKFYYQVKYATLRLDANNTTTFYDDNAPRLVLADGAVITITNSRREGCTAVVTANKTDEYGRPIKNPDGTIQTKTWTSSGCAYLKFDANGPKKPNQYGRDVYGVTVLRNKIRPDGGTYGSNTLINILSGNEEFEYSDYQKDQKVDF